MESDGNILRIVIYGEISTGKNSDECDKEIEYRIIEIHRKEDIAPDKRENRCRKKHGIKIPLLLIRKTIKKKGNHHIDKDDILHNGIG